jgi:hypothetical protein
MDMHHPAKQVCRDKSPLFGLKTNQANNHAVNPASTQPCQRRLPTVETTIKQRET